MEELYYVKRGTQYYAGNRKWTDDRSLALTYGKEFAEKLRGGLAMTFISYKFTIQPVY